MIANSTELAATGMPELRALALRVATAGLVACDAGRATSEVTALTDDGIAIDGREYPLKPEARVIVVGSGKATLAIAGALEELLADRIEGGVAVVRHAEDTIGLERIEVIMADHPLPSERSAVAARRILGLVDGLGPDDLVLAAFTGGSSALTSLPPEGVSQAEKRRLHELLLSSGAPIIEVNAVRKHVSAIKGGRLAARIAPARLVSLTVSDVAGDVLDAITDPTVQDTSTVEDAVDVLHGRGLWGELPESIRNHLATDAAHSPRLESEPQTVMLVNGAGACEAMAAEARAAGVGAYIISTELEGEAGTVGRQLAGLAKDWGGDAAPVPAPCVLLGCGGEATVTLQSNGTGESFGMAVTVGAGLLALAAGVDGPIVPLGLAAAGAALSAFAQLRGRAAAPP